MIKNENWNLMRLLFKSQSAGTKDFLDLGMKIYLNFYLEKLSTHLQT